MRRLKQLTLVMACVGFSACSDEGWPRARAPLEPTAPQVLRRILVQSTTSPPLAHSEASMQACRDRTESLTVEYSSPGSIQEPHAQASAGKRSLLLRLTIPKGALHRRPDGRRFGRGECIHIHAEIDPERLLVEFHPHGLAFHPRVPAKLTWWYGNADPDFNGDGLVAIEDDRIESDFLGVWRLPHDDEPWERLRADHSIGVKRFDLDLDHFSHYAVAH